MRGDNGSRGESERVAERVRALLAADAGATDTAAADDGQDGHAGGARGQRADHEGGTPERVSPWRRLVATVPLRLDPGRRAAVATGLAALVAAALAAVWLVSSRPSAVPVAGANAAPGSPLVASASALAGSPTSVTFGATPSGGSTSAAPAATGEVVVDVAGKVRRPGLYHLPAGSRVDDAITAAGGALRGVDLSSLNLASKVIDGQQIAVGKPGAVAVGPAGNAGAGGGGAGGATGTTGAPVNLNTATLDQLQTLPGIGPALGQRILDYRTQHGSFGSVDQLDDVAGIGTVTFARLKPLVTV